MKIIGINPIYPVVGEPVFKMLQQLLHFRVRSNFYGNKSSDMVAHATNILIQSMLQFLPAPGLLHPDRNRLLNRFGKVWQFPAKRWR